MFLRFSLAVFFFIIWMSFIVLAPQFIVNISLAFIAGWQMGQWIPRFSFYLAKKLEG